MNGVKSFSSKKKVKGGRVPCGIPVYTPGGRRFLACFYTTFHSRSEMGLNLGSTKTDKPIIP